jgi:predicted RNase H-like HicB family nuclease
MTQYQVVIESHSEQEFVASVVGIPDCLALGTSREEAITKAKNILTEKIARGELVAIEIEPQPIHQDADPWLKHFGIFADDPTFVDFLEEVEAYRQSIDEPKEA